MALLGTLVFAGGMQPLQMCTARGWNAPAPRNALAACPCLPGPEQPLQLADLQPLAAFVVGPRVVEGVDQHLPNVVVYQAEPKNSFGTL